MFPLKVLKSPDIGGRMNFIEKLTTFQTNISPIVSYVIDFLLFISIQKLNVIYVTSYHDISSL